MSLSPNLSIKTLRKIVNFSSVDLFSIASTFTSLSENASRYKDCRNVWLRVSNILPEFIVLTSSVFGVAEFISSKSASSLRRLVSLRLCATFCFCTCWLLVSSRSTLLSRSPCCCPFPSLRFASVRFLPASITSSGVVVSAIRPPVSFCNASST